MKYFSIKELEGFSCVKAHTLRIWEQRFNFLKPQRNPGNIRYYALDDVSYLLTISLLNKAGYKISKLAGMDDVTIQKNLQGLTSEEDRQCREINRLITSMFALDTEEFDSVLNNCLLYWGIDITLQKIIIPFLERVQIFTCRDCDIEIDFAITALRKKIILGIEKANPSVQVDRTVLLFLPEGEHFDLLLLYCNYLIKSIGFKVLYMGTNVSMQKLKSIIQTKNPHFFITYISPKLRLKVSHLKEYFIEHLSGSSLLVSRFENEVIRPQRHHNMKFVRYTHLSEALMNVG